MPINIPPIETVQKFEVTTQPLFQRMKANDGESRTLAALLPRLLSGELHVPAAAKQVEDYA